MGKRTAVTAADLFVLLERELRKRRPRECAACFIQLPYRVDPEDEGAANWEVIVPPPCPKGCNMVIDELAEEFQRLYDLKPG